MYFRHYPTAETNKNHYCNCFYVSILDFYYDKFEASTLPVYTMSSYIDSLLNSECNQEFADPHHCPIRSNANYATEIVICKLYKLLILLYKVKNIINFTDNLMH